jgi:hypothetical protein
MKKNLKLLGVIIIAVFFLHACGLIFDTSIKRIPKKQLVDYQIGDIIIFTTEKTLIDTFKITLYRYFEDDEEKQEELSCKLSDSRSRKNKDFHMVILPYNILFLNMINESTIIPGISFSDPSYELEINGTQYKDVYIFENDLDGDSDTLLNKIYYHPRKGILGYRYENGDEYLLEEIKYAE